MNFLKAKVTNTNALAIVLAVVALGGLGYAGARVSSRLILEARVRSELIRVSEHAREQRQRLVAAITSYKESFGCYPSDHLISKEPVVVDPVTNQLYYELLGTVYDLTNHSFTPLGSSTRLPAVLVQNFFNIERFKNSAETANAVKSFLSGTETLMEVHDKPETIGLLSFFPNWEGANWDAIGEMQFGSWEYNSSKPLHNPAGFDIWIEIKAPGTNIVIGNW
jgi:hypothetical protein